MEPNKLHLPRIVVLCKQGIQASNYEETPRMREDLVKGKTYEAIEYGDGIHYVIPSLHPTFGFYRDRFVPVSRELCKRYNDLIGAL